ncbi:hypothetical protein [Yoonia litorea]|uniref:Uncharacterized protein n=1 Tax=Yoonia litorea TaxID=1123755 RepID=A0A1I6LAX7_9RHOB|nr:hypothetical protein [Yoonia litorea]SFS00621.1 hypothetical protein SAMN05444714_0354 [Yoonia litorea]
MTRPDDDLIALKRAFEETTPVPQPQKRMQDIAQAEAVFKSMHASAAKKIPSRRFSWKALGAGLGGLTTAAVALVLVIPPQQQVSIPENAVVSSAESRAAMPLEGASLADESAVEELAEERMATPQAAPGTFATAEDSQSLRAAPTDQVAALRSTLESGRLPVAGDLDAQRLLTALTSDVNPLPSARYALPWSDDVILLDAGAYASPRFTLSLEVAEEPPLVDLKAALPDIRMVAAIAGFAALLESGETDLNDWSYADALNIAEEVGDDFSGSSGRIVLELLRNALQIATSSP